MSTNALLSIILLLSAIDVWADGGVVPFSSDKWHIEARESRVEHHLGRESLFLKGGSALLEGSNMLNGIMEFDIAFSNDRGFMGAVWRKQDKRNYEYFYLRPHQSGKPDACQYTPAFNGLTGWQLYHGQGYGAAIDFTFDQWMHVKIVVSGRRGEVYVNDMKTPALFIADMKHKPASGELGVLAGNFSPAWYTNFSYQPMDEIELQGTAQPEEPAPDGSIMRWQVSDAFSEAALNDVTQLGQEQMAGISWHELRCESTGLANLARLQGISRDSNTVFAKITIISTHEQVEKLSFGYSDRVKAYFNGQLIYGGTNDYQSRDFRYLGTIGLFDDLFLPLWKGENELWLAVSESFGGWGLKAKFDDMSGIEIARK